MSRDVAGVADRGAWDEKQSYTPGQLAVVCRVAPELPGKWARRGRIPCIETPGRHRRYWRPDLPFLPKLGDPQLLTLADVGWMVGVGPFTVRRWVLDRKLYGVRLPGGHHRVWRQDIDQLLTQMTVSHGK